MSEDEVRFYKLAEACRDGAAQARNSVDEEAWLKLADDWLTLARASEKPRQRPPRGALHPINGDQKIRPLQYFDQFVEDYPLVIAGPRFPSILRECAARQ